MMQFGYAIEFLVFRLGNNSGGFFWEVVVSRMDYHRGVMRDRHLRFRSFFRLGNAFCPATIPRQLSLFRTLGFSA